jgi:hypothetical protein
MKEREYCRSLEHRKIWEKHYGKIPFDCCIHHKNGNKKDNRIENLECLSRKEHGKRHRKSNKIRNVSSKVKIKVKHIRYHYI